MPQPTGSGPYGWAGIPWDGRPGGHGLNPFHNYDGGGPVPEGMGPPNGFWTPFNYRQPGLRPGEMGPPRPPMYGHDGYGVPWNYWNISNPELPGNPGTVDTGTSGEGGGTILSPGGRPRGGGGGGGNIGFPNFDPNNPYGPPPDILTGQGFMPWAPMMPSGMGMWSGQQDFGGGMGFPPMGGGPGGGGAGPFAPAPPGDPMAGGMNAFQTYLSAIPVMEGARDSQIGQAMATSGLTGNRFSGSAQRTAGQIGANTALQQNQLLANLLHDETGRTLDRGLQATGMGLQNEQFRNELALRASMGDRDAMMQAAQLGIGLGTAQDQMMQDRIRLLQGFGSWEQGRQDQFARTGFDQFNADRLGPIPMILQALSGSSGSSGGSSQTQTGGSPGAIDYAVPIIMAMIAASDGRLKTNIHTVGSLGPVRLVTWDWKDGSGPGFGVIAQELEVVLPEAVIPDPATGLKRVNYAALSALVN